MSADLDLNKKVLSDIVVHSKYARYLPEKYRRETYDEIITRTKEMHKRKFPNLASEIDENFAFVYSKEILPSMRFLQFAGKSIEVNPTRGYNCSFLHVDDYRAFSETMFLLLGGTGVGYSVQRHHVAKLPPVRKPIKTKRFVVGDSIEGWADAIKVLMKAYLSNGPKPKFDFSDIRQKGALLVTSGGKAPGPDPLKKCIFNIEMVLESKKDGEQLTPLECHDIQCHIADAVLAGGIRRAAMISLFSMDDDEMLGCKSGNWWETNPQRGRANNSVVVMRSMITEGKFWQLWEKIKASGAGEPGISFTNDPELGFNPCVSSDTIVATSEGQKTVSQLIGKKFKALVHGKEYSSSEEGFFYTGKRELYELKTSYGYSVKCTLNHKFLLSTGEWKQACELVVGDKLIIHNHTGDGKVCDVEFLSFESTGVVDDVYDCTIDEVHAFDANGLYAHNCHEAALKHGSFCNLTEINFSIVKDQEHFNRLCKAAAFIGTLQASYTDFHYLREVWKKTTEKDALLGVSLTGIADEKLYNIDLKQSAEIVMSENERVAKQIGINKASRTTLGKPSGSASIVLGTSSGIHAWHSKYYIRRMRFGKNEAIYEYLKTKLPELVEDEYFRPTEQAVISIPIKAPDGAILRTESPLELLKRVKYTYENWIKPGHRSGANTHNYSCTVSVKEDEWETVGKWMWENRDSYSGLSILPYDSGTYKQTPFEECDEETYNRLSQYVKDIDLSEVLEFNDDTNLAGEAACAGGACEVK